MLVAKYKERHNVGFRVQWETKCWLPSILKGTMLVSKYNERHNMLVVKYNKRHNNGWQAQCWLQSIMWVAKHNVGCQAQCWLAKHIVAAGCQDTMFIARNKMCCTAQLSTELNRCSGQVSYVQTTFLSRSCGRGLVFCLEPMFSP